MITRKDFEQGNFKKRVNSRDKHPVLLFLKKNRFHAYTIKEIIKAVGMGEDTCRSMLRILKKDKLIEHKIPYFAIKENNPKKKKKVKKKGKKNAQK